ncbi:MAG: type IX secretion system membrane protein PorP/SprF [Bacteroidales bacterium]|nr:type IX secretion system membrane protein PorP/SprF [Bacteroidales bacterium]
MSVHMRIKLSKKLSLLVIALGFSCATMAQEPQFSQYMFNRMSFNPGYAGSSGSICATLMYRNQWMGLKLDNPTNGSDAGSTPTDILFSFDMPVKFLHGGLGFTFVKDEIGYHDNIYVNLDYAFRMFWGDGNLSAGAELGLLNSSFDPSALHGNDANDPAIPTTAASEMLIDASVGLYYQVPGKYYVGLAAKNLLGAHSEALAYRNVRTIYAMGGYEYTPAGAPSVRIKPSALLRTAAFSYFQADLSCLIDYRNAFWGGLGYRVTDAIYLLAGVHWKKLRIGASYDITTSSLGTFKPGRSFGSAELYLKYCFKVVIPQKAPTSYGNSIYLL